MSNQMTELAKVKKQEMLDRITERQKELRAMLRMSLEDIPRLFKDSMTEEEITAFTKEYQDSIQVLLPQDEIKGFVRINPDTLSVETY